MSGVELLTWDGVPLTGAILHDDLSGLRDAMFRGENLTMPQARGRRPYDPVLDELDVVVRWRILGRLEHTTLATASDPIVQASVNREYYRGLFLTGGDTYGRHVAELSMAGTVFEGLVQCRGFSSTREKGGLVVQAITRLVVAAGEMDEPS